MHCSQKDVSRLQEKFLIFKKRLCRGKNSKTEMYFPHGQGMGNFKNYPTQSFVTV